MTTATDGKNRTRPSSRLYRVLMEVLEARRIELNISMAVVNDLAGLQDGFFSKMIYPDTPHGRQARWETVQLAVQALFGEDFTITIASGKGENRVLKSALCFPKTASTNAINMRHWRHKRHFQELGSLGGKAFFSGKDKDERSAIMRKRAKKRWLAHRKAKRQGEEHRNRNAEQKAAAVTTDKKQQRTVVQAPAEYRQNTGEVRLRS